MLFCDKHAWGGMEMHLLYPINMLRLSICPSIYLSIYPSMCISYDTYTHNIMFALYAVITVVYV